MTDKIYFQTRFNKSCYYGVETWYLETAPVFVREIGFSGRTPSPVGAQRKTI